ncbi:MAG TPA: von Willebrand factor type A domain-containing protein [Alphaproteobacteria bacterium]|nr:von Willebrand factor type A domain-containing protein [Alphaproteobacteria bacterium]
MRRGLILLAAAAAMTFASIAGCDDDSSGPKPVKAEKHVAASPAARLGAGWRATADARVSSWGFSTGAPIADPVETIRAAIESGSLPPRSAVRITPLIQHFAIGLPAPEAGGAPFRASVALTVTPWNDDTLLLWVGVVGDGASGALMPRDLAQSSERPGITVEFDPKMIAAYRPAGEPDAMQAGDGVSAVAALYELSPLRDLEREPRTQLAVVRIRYRMPGSSDPEVHEIDRPITGADLVESIDDAPETARFAAAVVGFGELLRGDPAVRDLSCSEAIALAQGATGADPDGTRARFVALMRQAEPLIDQPPTEATQAGDSAR